MVVLDDSDTKGFLFSYEKLFGVKEKTDTDIKNEKEGKDTSLLRTARLFYVACTRAKDSLAVVVYSENPDKVKQTAMINGWFSETEIIFLN
jgi:DNA helicase-2/ATP-dependent DNA helicase PcrA